MRRTKKLHRLAVDRMAAPIKYKDRWRRMVRDAQRMRDIVNAVAAASHIQRPALIGDAKSLDFCDARFVAMRIARAAGISMPQIGGALGGRDHTTVLSGLRSAAQLVARDCPRGQYIARIQERAERILAGMERAEAPPPAPAAGAAPAAGSEPAESPAPTSMSPAPPEDPSPPPRPQPKHGMVDRFGQIICNP